MIKEQFATDKKCRLAQTASRILVGCFIALSLSGCQVKSLNEVWNDMFGPTPPPATTQSQTQATARTTPTQQPQSAPAMTQSTPDQSATPTGEDLENTLYMDLEYGRVVIKTLPEVAPKHVARIKELVRQGFYDGLTFHRVIPGFVAQGGDPDGNGTGGSGTNIPAEFSALPHDRGTLSMARSSDPDSADSQFFICFARQRSLDKKYSVWGQVTDGMAFVGMLKRGRAGDGFVAEADKIIKMQVAADAK